MSSYWYWYDYSMDAATLIRATRESAGLSQGALAARAGTSQPAVSRYESGASSPSVETLDRLLAVMGVRLDLVAEASPRRLDVRTPRMLKLRENRERIRRAAHRHGAKNVRIFGSVAVAEMYCPGATPAPSGTENVTFPFWSVVTENEPIKTKP